MPQRASLYLTIALAGIAAGAFAAPVAAQDRYRPTGTRIVQPQEEADPDFARRLLKRTAACVNRYDAAGVVTLLRGGNQAAIDYAAEGVRNEDNRSPLQISECLDEAMNGSQLVVDMRIPPRALRTVLAEEAYLSRHAGPLALPAGSPQVIEGRAVIGGDTPERARAMGIFADCLVFNAPAEADRLLRGPVGGDEERDNARALAPAISQCLTAGQAANFTTSAIRDYVADGLWARSEYLAAQGSGE